MAGSAVSRTSHFHVARWREVAIKRKCFTDSPSAHDLKAHCIDKRIHALIVSAQPSPGLVFDLRVGMDYNDPG